MEDDVVDREDDFDDLDDEDCSITGTDPIGGAGALATATSVSAESSTFIALSICSSFARRSVSTSSALMIMSKFDGRRALGAAMYWKRLELVQKLRASTAGW